jgi:hypothetical protein
MDIGNKLFWRVLLAYEEDPISDLLHIEPERSIKAADKTEKVALGASTSKDVDRRGGESRVDPEDSLYGRLDGVRGELSSVRNPIEVVLVRLQLLRLVKRLP